MTNTCHFPSDHQHGRAMHTALWIAFAFMLIEVAGGLIANSLALISDAMHLFTDVGAFLLSLIALKIARRPSTPEMSYGYHRAEILGALASAVSLWALSGVLIYEAITRLFHPPEVQGPIVFVVAFLGLIANLLMMRVLHSCQQHNMNMRAAYLHVLGDLLGSIGVILSGAILWLTDWKPIDPIVTIVFSLQLIYISTKLIKQTVNVLMEGTPEGVDITTIRNDLSNIVGVTEVHDLHLWAVASKRNALSVHLVSTQPHETLNAVHRLISKKYHIQHMTVQVEDPTSFEAKYCFDCQKDHSNEH